MRAAASALLIWTSLACASSCGGDDAVPIDQIPPDKKLTSLSDAEVDGVCMWGAMIAEQKLPPGTSCGGTPVGYTGCMPVPAACPATVGQWQVCVPALLDRFARDPCAVFSFAFSPDAFANFIEETPGCTGFGPCGTTVVM